MREGTNGRCTNDGRTAGWSSKPPRQQRQTTLAGTGLDTSLKAGTPNRFDNSRSYRFEASRLYLTRAATIVAAAMKPGLNRRPDSFSTLRDTRVPRRRQSADSLADRRPPGVPGQQIRVSAPPPVASGGIRRRAFRNRRTLHV